MRLYEQIKDKLEKTKKKLVKKKKKKDNDLDDNSIDYEKADSDHPVHEKYAGEDPIKE